MGSIVLNGIVVARAGLVSRHDEMFAYWLATAIQVEARKGLGSGLIDQSQRMTAAVMHMTEKNVWAHRS